MIDEYVIDTNFKDVMFAITLGKTEEPFHAKDGYLLYGNRLCVAHNMRKKLRTNPTLLHIRDIEGFKLRSRKHRCTFIGQP